MDILLTIACCVIVLSVLVFIHEGGHFIASRLFGVRVTEFMLGLPGPNIGFKHGETKYGVTCIPLGGYARVCGMEAGNMKPHLKRVYEYMLENKKANANDVSNALNISEEAASDCLFELFQWGSVSENKDVFTINKFCKKTFKEEYFCQYRSLPFWKRIIILLAGIFVNLLFAMIIFVILYTLVGFDVKYQDTGEIAHVTMNPLQAIQYGFNYIWLVIQAVVKLFNPATAAETVNNSTSLIGIAVISKSAAERGICAFLEFMAMISVSLGIMNLLPIPPLDGGKFIVEIIQKITGKNVPERVVTLISIVGIALFLLLFIIMIRQDIQRFIL
ncbi:MAG: site-2 protease family protein [Coriobacteriia bacterium]|nr:site-2 protease family protein [Coriobacteriia bacterium]